MVIQNSEFVGVVNYYGITPRLISNVGLGIRLMPVLTGPKLETTAAQNLDLQIPGVVRSVPALLYTKAFRHPMHFVQNVTENLFFHYHPLGKDPSSETGAQRSEIANGTHTLTSARGEGGDGNARANCAAAAREQFILP